MERAQQIYNRPHQGSYFVPGEVAGHPVRFLLDTGCTTNLLSKHIFDRLPREIRAKKEDYAKHGLLADGTRLPFFGILQLDIRLSEMKTRETFIVSQIDEDAILGMPFLVEHHCAMEFRKPVLQLDGQEVRCTDRQEKMLDSHVQAAREAELPAASQGSDLREMTSREFCSTGVAETQLTEATRPVSNRGQLLKSCTTPTRQSTKLMEGMAKEVKEEVRDRPAPNVQKCSGPTLSVPGKARDLSESARWDCHLARAEQLVMKLLESYGRISSPGGRDSLTPLVWSSMPTESSSGPARQQHGELRPQKANVGPSSRPVPDPPKTVEGFVKKNKEKRKRQASSKERQYYAD